MDSNRFDDFTKGLARGTTRRQALKAIAATLSGALGLGQAGEALAADCKGVGSKCTKTSHCCMGLTCGVNKICCVSNSGSCSASSNCCSGNCSNGICCAGGQTNCGGSCVNEQTDVNHCGACGNVCSSNNGTASCVNGTCQITCNAGFFNCNGNSADGCECQGTGCCAGGTCQTAHNNGVGQTYYDCFPLGQPGNPATYNQAMAQDACNAFTAVNGGTCLPAFCGGDAVIIGETLISCVTWQYTGALAGFVNSISGPCTCPNGGSPTWT